MSQFEPNFLAVAAAYKSLHSARKTSTIGKKRQKLTPFTYSMLRFLASFLEGQQLEYGGECENTESTLSRMLPPKHLTSDNKSRSRLQKK
ncbi:hypothetical protein DFQ29_007462 [Apophysomyces sp. BC1021]|nr:hypothetical protein DFQ29_007462 [Apophysomyces sp. BC1021]